jgi:hypothetical protein
MLGQLLSAEHGSRLLAYVRYETARHLAHLEVLKQLGTALEGAGLPWAVLKGPVLAEISYGRASRGYSDIDLVVPASRLREAVAALEGVGAVLAEPDWLQLVRSGKGQLKMVSRCPPLKVPVDLHWHLLYKRSERQRYRIGLEEVLERRRRVQLQHVQAWALEPTDFAAHVALHAAQSGAHQLRWLLDIERTLVAQPPAWDVFVRRCRSWRVGLPVSVALNRARRTVGAPVPEEVVSELAGGRLNRIVVRQLGAWVPVGRMPGGRSVVAGLTRSVRDNLVTTASEFAVETWQVLARMLDSSPAGAPGPPTGGAAERAWFERYLAMVDSADRYGHVSRWQCRRLALQAEEPAASGPRGAGEACPCDRSPQCAPRVWLGVGTGHRHSGTG